MLYGGYRVINSIFGKNAAQKYLDDFDQFGDFSPASVYDVFRESFAWRTFDVLKKAGVTAARLHERTERTQPLRLRDQFAPLKN